LEQCRFEHAVSITPANPVANETITVTIHPRWPLRRRCWYEVIITDIGGHPEDGFVHALATRTRTLTVHFSPAEGGLGGSPVTAWAPGEASLLVIEGTLGQLKSIASHPKWRQVADLEFRFRPVP
jgi:hypothetical protein